MELQDFIITRFNNIYIANNQKGRILEQKNRQRSCFIIPLSGSIKLICNGETTVTDCQHPVFIPEGLTYTNVCIEEAKSLVFNFHTLKKYDAPVSLSKISPRLATEAYEAIEKAVVAVDACVKDVIEAAKATGYEAIIIADHGNADNAVNSDDTPNTAHSLNPVPCVYVTENKSAKIENGILADVAPSILNIMGLEQPTEMSGKNLIK